MHIALALAALVASFCTAGDFSIHEKDARVFVKVFRRCFQEKDQGCLADRLQDKIQLDIETNYGCKAASPGVLTRDEFLSCLLSPRKAQKNQTSLRDAVLDCLSVKSEWRDEVGGLRGRRGVWCYIYGSSDDARLSKVTRKFP